MQKYLFLKKLFKVQTEAQMKRKTKVQKLRRKKVERIMRLTTRWRPMRGFHPTACVRARVSVRARVISHGTSLCVFMSLLSILPVRLRVRAHASQHLP